MHGLYLKRLKFLYFIILRQIWGATIRCRHSPRRLPDGSGWFDKWAAFRRSVINRPV